MKLGRIVGTVVSTRKDEKIEGRKGSAEDVRVEVLEHSEGVTICAVYPNRPGKRANRCAAEDSHLGNHDNDTRVEFRVEVPRGIDLVAASVNGNVDVRDVSGNVKASTVNGDVDVFTQPEFNWFGERQTAGK